MQKIFSGFILSRPIKMKQPSCSCEESLYEQNQLFFEFFSLGSTELCSAIHMHCVNRSSLLCLLIVF